MKKQLFLIAGAVLTLASCSKDEPVSTNNGNAIDFRAAMQTRAAETTTANIDKFFVTAFDKNDATFFADVKFEKDDQYFTSTPSYYWPSDGSTLSFVAYSPSKAELNNSLRIDSKIGPTIVDFSPNVDIADQVDLIAATATGSKSDESTGVALTFQHLLSQIEIKAKNTNEGYIYKVQGVRIGKPFGTGSFAFVGGDSWNENGWRLGADDTKANYEVTYEAAKTLNETAVSLMDKDGDNAMLIPQQLNPWDYTKDKTNIHNGAYLAVKVQITTKDGARVYPVASVGDYDWVAVAIDTKWDAGKKYIYTLDFTNGAGKVDPEKPEPIDPEDPFKPGEDIFESAIKFTVDVTAWVNATEDIEM